MRPGSEIPPSDAAMMKDLDVYANSWVWSVCGLLSEWVHRWPDI